MNEKAMNEKVDEQISALVDGELGSDEQEFLLRRLAKDERLQGKWHRYNLISDALQNHLPTMLDTGLTKKLNHALENEDSLHAGNLPTGSIKRKLVKSVAGLSIAASVAVFSIIGIQQYNSLQVNSLQVDDSFQAKNDINSVNLASNAALFSNMSNTVNKEILAAVRQPVLKNGVSPVYIRVSGTRWDHDRPKVGSRLNGYLVNHNEYTSATNLQGLVNYSKIAGYDIQK